MEIRQGHDCAASFAAMLHAEYLEDADRYRLIRRQRHASGSVSALDGLLDALGALLISWGSRLREHHRAGGRHACRAPSSFDPHAV